MVLQGLFQLRRVHIRVKYVQKAFYEPYEPPWLTHDRETDATGWDLIADYQRGAFAATFTFQSALAVL